MCNLYAAPSPEQLSLDFGVPTPTQGQLWAPTIAPLKPGPFIPAMGAMRVGQWGMIPPGSPTRKPTHPRTGRPLSTNNARREGLERAMTYRGPWKAGQRCLIPAVSFDEPYWGTGKNIWWRFWRADGKAWALAGIWAEWTDPATGEVVASHSMITQNCDAHPLLRLMHRPDPRMPPDQQDKRAVVPVEREDWEQWLTGTQEQSEQLIRLPAIELFRHSAVDIENQVTLPV
jgi:putative SOS response-associated peptidase YedK